MELRNQQHMPMPSAGLRASFPGPMVGPGVCYFTAQTAWKANRLQVVRTTE
jgi:hypothetical protein